MDKNALTIVAMADTLSLIAKAISNNKDKEVLYLLESAAMYLAHAIALETGASHVHVPGGDD